MAATSLSPRPETLMMIISSLLSFGARLTASAIACELSIAGMIPSVLLNKARLGQLLRLSLLHILLDQSL